MGPKDVLLSHLVRSRIPLHYLDNKHYLRRRWWWRRKRRRKLISKRFKVTGGMSFVGYISLFVTASKGPKGQRNQRGALNCEFNSKLKKERWFWKHLRSLHTQVRSVLRKPPWSQRQTHVITPSIFLQFRDETPSRSRRVPHRTYCTVSYIVTDPWHF
jgi:hypothetical protein